MTDHTAPAATQVSKRLRYEILRRDEFRCRYCGAPASDTELQVDHVVPTSLGGPTDPTNLVAACVDCNIGKSATNPDDRVVEDVRLRDQQFRDTVAALVAERRAHRDRRWEQVGYILRYWAEVYDRDLQQVPADANDSIMRFLDAGLHVEDLVEAINLAHARVEALYDCDDRVFRYFCGICHRIIKDLEVKAGRIVNGDSDG